jgi:hypothetical protein
MNAIKHHKRLRFIYTLLVMLYASITPLDACNWLLYAYFIASLLHDSLID